MGTGRFDLEENPMQNLTKSIFSAAMIAGAALLLSGCVVEPNPYYQSQAYYEPNVAYVTPGYVYPGVVYAPGAYGYYRGGYYGGWHRGGYWRR